MFLPVTIRKVVTPKKIRRGVTIERKDNFFRVVATGLADADAAGAGFSFSFERWLGFVIVRTLPRHEYA
jgi:hypothetical protein